MTDRSEAKRKELETRKRLGPRLGYAPVVRRRTAEPPAIRIPRVRMGRAHPTRDST